jgi:hypothetical protein
MAARRGATKARETERKTTSGYVTCTQCDRRFFSGVKAERPVCGWCKPIDGGVDWKSIPRPQQALDREAMMLLRDPEDKPAPVRDGSQLWDYDPRDDEPWRVVLSPDDVFWASDTAVRIAADNVRRGTTPAHGLVARSLAYEIIGTLGELAFARMMGIPWAGHTTYDRKRRDVGHYEVRSVESGTHALLLHPDDKPEAPYVLMVGSVTTWRMAGWVLGSEGMDQRYWRDPGTGRPAYFVPQSALRAPATLPAWQG